MLVDYDKLILRWALEHLEDCKAQIDAVSADAAVYMQQNATRYDLVFIDVFNGMVVPAFVSGEPFLRQCRSSLNKGGHMVLNYIVHEPAEWARTEQAVASVFPNYKVVQNGVNRIFIAVAGE